METAVLARHDLLTSQRRFGGQALPQVRPTLAEYLWLAGCGATAGSALVLLDFSLRIPGHAILRTVLPLVCGLALVPRLGAGSVMSLAATFTAAALHWGGRMGELPAGSMTSLLLAGPSLDLALRNAKPGWWLYLRVCVVGMLVNWAALAAKTAEIMLGRHTLRNRTPQQFLDRALLTYTLCGILAGLISAAIFFRARDVGRGMRDEASPADPDLAGGAAP